MSAFFMADAPLDAVLTELAEEAGVDLLPVTARREIQALVLDDRYDRLYSALPYAYHDLDLSRIGFHFTIHGLRPLELPTDAYENRYGRTVRARARAGLKRHLGKLYVRRRREEFARLLSRPVRERAVITPSEHTKYSLLAQFPSLDPATVHVFYSPPKLAPSPLGDSDAKRLLASMDVVPRRYFLLISANRWVKNAIRGIEAMDHLFSARPDLPHRVLVVGVEREGDLAVTLGNPARFSFRDYAGAQELETMYAHAFALLFPTLNEGFGYPPLEAMRYGTPVICSAVASTTEVCGDGVLYVDPRQRGEIAARALQLLMDPAVWEEMAERARERQRLVQARQERMLRGLCQLLRAETA